MLLPFKSPKLAGCKHLHHCPDVQMCEDMAADNVVYAEIRTTPKVRATGR